LLLHSLEKPCTDHLHFLVKRAHDSDEKFSGHALMASCPPESYIEANPETEFGNRAPNLNAVDLTTLLNTCSQFNLEGEVTPVMAWAMILRSPRFYELSKDDFKTIQVELEGKVRCYGYVDL
jgi:hypothetical protein